MKLRQLDCPYCGAGLMLGDEGQTFFCSHCGRRIALEEDEELKARVKIREMELAYEDKVLERENKRFRQRKHFNVFIILLLFAAVAACAIGMSTGFMNGKLGIGLIIISVYGILMTGIHLSTLTSPEEKRKQERHKIEIQIASEKEVQKLETLEKQILSDIQNKQYIEALAKSQTLVYTLDDSPKVSKVWKQKQKDLIRTINQLMKTK